MWEIILFIICLCLSAFFSGYESAILSVRLSKIRELVSNNVPNAKLVQKIKENQHKAVITLLIGNNVVNILASSLATKMTFDYFAKYSIAAGYTVGIATGVMTFILLIFGEITPKTVGLKKSEAFALRGAKVFYFFNILFRPLVFFFQKMSLFIVSIFGIPQNEKSSMTTGELREFVQMSHERGSIVEHQKEMMHNILDFSETSAKEIMMPLANVVSINVNSSVQDALELMAKENFSRLPVYEKNLSNIVGVIYIKDILGLVRKSQEGVKIRKIMRKIGFVPSAKKINMLFNHFKNKKEHIAVVVDEFGNSLGIVTMEDVLEELVGEIQDESDTDEDELKLIDENTLIAPGVTNLEKVNELLKVKMDDQKGSFQTISGYIMHHTGKIPKRGSVVTAKEVKITIIDSSHKKINQVKIEKFPRKKII